MLNLHVRCKGYGNLIVLVKIRQGPAATRHAHPHVLGTKVKHVPVSAVFGYFTGDVVERVQIRQVSCR